MSKFVHETTDLEISPEIVVPVSGKSALCSSQLKTLVDSGVPFEDRLKLVCQELRKYPDIEQSLPGGECEVTIFDQLEPTELSCMLDKACGIDIFSKRYIQEPMSYVKGSKFASN